MRRGILFIALAVGRITGQSLPQSQVELLARALREKHSAENRASLTAYAAAHRADQPGALALLALGAHSQGEEAAAHLQQAAPRLTRISDYVAYLTAREQYEAKAYAAAGRTATQALGVAADSPILPRLLLIAARATWKSGDLPGARRFLDTHRARMPQPAAGFLQAQIEEEAGDAATAITRYRRIWLESPRSSEAADAEKALARLDAPAASLADRLKRGLALVEGNDNLRAIKELSALLPDLSGRDRDFARVRLGLAEVQARSYTAAYNRLKPEAAEAAVDAERLHHLMTAARRLGRPAEAITIAEDLRQKHPTSVWRLQALIAAGDQFYQQNDAPRSESLFASCATGFAQPQAAYCHWKTVFADHLQRKSGTRAEFLDHLKRFPQSPHASAVLYFLGRLAEEAKDAATAKAYYQRASKIYPNHFYALLSRERLREDAIATLAPASTALGFLDSIPWPAPPVKPSFEVSPANRQRQDRANLLAQAAIDELSDLELRSGATEQPHVTAMLLAEFAQRRGEPEKGIRAIKGLYPAYFSLPLEDAPFQFWQLAYPLPWRSQLEGLAKEHELDPFMVAGLIRQESEFDAEAISRSNARGLTQVMPMTGLDLSRRVGLKGFYTGLLHSPEVNLKLGTYYMRWLLNLTDHRPEFMLASYNAGKTRVDGWRDIYRYREPAEFVESIPLSETRNYVQVVLRNADFYRRLYSGRPDTFTPTPAAKALPPPPAAAPAAVRNPQARKPQVSSKNAQSGRKVVSPTRRSH